MRRDGAGSAVGSGGWGREGGVGEENTKDGRQVSQEGACTSNQFPAFGAVGDFLIV